MFFISALILHLLCFLFQHLFFIYFLFSQFCFHLKFRHLSCIFSFNFNKLFIYPVIHPLTNPCILPSNNHPSTYSFTYSSFRPFIVPISHHPISLFIHPAIHPSPSISSITRLSIYQPSNPPTLQSTHPCIKS